MRGGRGQRREAQSQLRCLVCCFSSGSPETNEATQWNLEICFKKHNSSHCVRCISNFRHHLDVYLFCRVEKGSRRKRLNLCAGWLVGVSGLICIVCVGRCELELR